MTNENEPQDLVGAQFAARNHLNTVHAQKAIIASQAGEIATLTAECERLAGMVNGAVAPTREKLMHTAINCGHMIDSDMIRLYRRAELEGNALSQLVDRLVAVCAIDSRAPATKLQTSEAAFKNFHRSLCARFGYTHDEQFWWRDLVSLEEAIASKVLSAGAPSEEVLSLHRRLAAETLRADQGWERYESANRDRNSLRAAKASAPSVDRNAVLEEAADICHAKFNDLCDSGHTREASAARACREEILSLMDSSSVVRTLSEKHNAGALVAWNDALTKTAAICDSAEKSAHPSDLADAIRALKSAAPAKPEPAVETSAVPEGWKLVPISPTDRMTEAGRDARLRGATHMDSLVQWRAMLAAFPAAPVAQPLAGQDAQAVTELTEADILESLNTLSHEPPKRLPPGWINFARSIERKVHARFAAPSPVNPKQEQN